MQLHLCILISLCFLSVPLTAQDGGPESIESFDALFRSAVQSYQKQDYSLAKDLFAKALTLEPQNASAMTNLGLTHFNLKERYWAIARFRHAISLDPSLSTAKHALDFALNSLEVKEIPHEIQLWESFRSLFLQAVSLESLAFLNALALFGTVWVLLGFLGRRRKALNEGSVLPSFPFVGLVFGIVFVFLLTSTGLKFWDQQQARATVLTDKVSARSLPEENAPGLFDLFGGLEVLVGQEQQDWVQVTYPGGPSGWIKKTEIYFTTGKHQ